MKKLIRTWTDLIENKVLFDGWVIGYDSKIKGVSKILAGEEEADIAVDINTAKSMKAAAMISQLMPYYGGAVAIGQIATAIRVVMNSFKLPVINTDNFNLVDGGLLRFNTEDEAENFLSHNYQLVHDYLMLS